MMQGQSAPRRRAARCEPAVCRDKSLSLHTAGLHRAARLGLGIWCLAALLLAGCSAKPDLNRAEAVVKTALDTWKGGGDPQQLASQGIDIADPDWAAGYKLLDYKVKSVAALPQQGPRVVALLNLKDRAAPKSKEVAYEVILGDKVRIGRDAFHGD
jgi:hypothetical protein